MSKVLSTTVTTEVDVDVDFTVDEVIDFLKDNGYCVSKNIEINDFSRSAVRAMIERIQERFGGTTMDTDYHHSATITVPAGSTVLIIPGL